MLDFKDNRLNYRPLQNLKGRKVYRYTKLTSETTTSTPTDNANDKRFEYSRFCLLLLLLML